MVESDSATLRDSPRLKRALPAQPEQACDRPHSAERREAPAALRPEELSCIESRPVCLRRMRSGLLEKPAFSRTHHIHGNGPRHRRKRNGISLPFLHILPCPKLPEILGRRVSLRGHEVLLKLRLDHWPGAPIREQRPRISPDDAVAAQLVFPFFGMILPGIVAYPEGIERVGRSEQRL